MDQSDFSIWSQFRFYFFFPRDFIKRSALHVRTLHVRAFHAMPCLLRGNLAEKRKKKRNRDFRE